MQKTLGKRLKDFRLANKLSQEEFAERLAISQPTLSKYERDGISDLGEIDRIQKLLNIQLVNLANTDDNVTKVMDSLKSYILQFYEGHPAVYATEQDLKNAVYCSPYYSQAMVLLEQNGEIRKKEEYYFPTSALLLQLEKRDFPIQYIYETQLEKREENLIQEDISEIIEDNEGADNIDNEKEEKEEEKVKQEENDRKVAEYYREHGEEGFALSDAIFAEKRSAGNILIVNRKMDLLKYNVCQLEHSMLVIDKDGALLESIGGTLQNHGFVLRILNLKDPEHSHSYNPIINLKSIEDIDEFVELFYPIESYSEENEEIKLKRMCLKAMIYYINFNPDMPKGHKNFYSIMKLLRAAKSKVSNEPEAASMLDKLFDKEERRDKNSISVRAFKNLKACTGSEKIFQETISSVQNDLIIFEFKKYKDLTCFNDFFGKEWSKDKKYAFFVIPGVVETIIEEIFYKDILKRYDYRLNYVFNGPASIVENVKWTQRCIGYSSSAPNISISKIRSELTEYHSLFQPRTTEYYSIELRNSNKIKILAADIDLEDNDFIDENTYIGFSLKQFHKEHFEKYRSKHALDYIFGREVADRIVLKKENAIVNNDKDRLKFEFDYNLD